MENDSTSNLIANRYKPLFTRARGGFSQVLIAWDTKLTRRVALKRINTTSSLPLSSLEEARTAAMLSSPNIVSVYDFEHTITETLIVMENVDGPSLAELMSDSRELLDIDVVTAILDDIVAALEYAHENQVLHLDIKPANVLIDQSGHSKVSDFGLAELAGTGGFGEVQGGTIGYMPPEQLMSDLVDIRTDLWAFAALAYQLLTGVNPFFALSPRESLERITFGRFALPSELRPELDGSVDEALVKALSPQKDTRQGSVAELWLELRPHLGKIGPGRRRLKTLTKNWMNRETAALEGPLEDSFSVAGEASEFEAEAARDGSMADSTELKRIAIWNGNYEDEEEEALQWAEDRDQRIEEKRQRREEKKKERQSRGPKPPLWQRLGPSAQALVSRLLCALAAAGMTWIALSALPYLSDPLAQAATVAATNTGSPVPALLDAAFIARLMGVAVVAIVACVIPTVGMALAALSLVFGFFFTGNWFIGMLVLIGSAFWWAFIGRRSPIDSALFTLAPLLAMLSLPMLLPLLAGYFQNWRRGLGTVGLAFFVCSLLSIVTVGSADVLHTSFTGLVEPALYGRFALLPLEELLSISPTMMQMPNVNELFIPLISLMTSAEFWLICAGWLGASVVMSLLIGGKSRVKYVLATLLGTGIVAMGYALPFLLLYGTDEVALLAATIIRLVLALAVCLLLMALGVQPQPHADDRKKLK